VLTAPAGPNEFTITAIPPGGMFGGMVGLTPSEDVLPKAAPSLCPDGYEKISEYKGVFEGEFIKWRIRCISPQTGQNSN
jgi:hypothetical protein